MADFWSPYESMQEAQTKLCRIADGAGGAGVGVSFSDGRSICVLRQARRTSGRTMWLNVLVTHAAAPPPPPPAPTTLGGKLKAWFWRAMEIEGQAQMQQAQAQMAADQAMAQEFHDHVWEPTHDFLLRHKLLADSAGLALDTVGVVAAGFFFFVAAPELFVAGGAMATAGLLTGTSASVGAIVLFAVDAVIYGAETSGHEAYAKKFEGSSTVGWVRIGATLMLLPDLPVGGLRALEEIGAKGVEASEAAARATRADHDTSKALRDLKNIVHPAKHSMEVARQMDRVRRYQAEAAAQAKLANAANDRIRLLLARDVALFPGATASGTGLIAAAPPDVALSAEQKRRDEQSLQSIAPAKGWSKDVKVEMRVIGYTQQGAH